jgi:hypothetical protein
VKENDDEKGDEERVAGDDECNADDCDALAMCKELQK